ncbi:MAG: SCO family protein [Polyangiaceae bacterium]|nr:SCO family protein [Polyangiaceae bacterium]
MKKYPTLMLMVCLGLALLAAIRPSSALAQSTPGGRPLEGAPSVPAGTVPKDLEGIGIEDKNGAVLPRDVKLTGSDGRSFVLGEYMDGERPLVLVLAYYGCPMLCSLVLNGTMTGVKGLNEIAGKDYRLLVVSFDPRDKVDIAQEKRKNYVEALGRQLEPIDGSQLGAFEFAVGDEAEVRRLAEAVGFNYRWDAAQDQYAHAAGIFIVTPKGVLSQALTGVEFPPDELRTAIAEANKEVWHSPLKSVLFYCFRFNPHTGKYTLIAARALRVAAGVTVLGLLFFVVRMFRADRRKKAQAQPGPA